MQAVRVVEDQKAEKDKSVRTCDGSGFPGTKEGFETQARENE
jgi:hypothetical protein